MNKSYQIKPACTDDVVEIVQYLRKHRYEHDESFLSEDDLSEFDISKDICLVARDQRGTIIAVFSVMKNLRVRIFHCTTNEKNVYRMLHREMVRLLSDSDFPEGSALTLFLPDTCDELLNFLKTQLGYQYERSVYVLERECAPIDPPKFPDGLILKDARFPEDASRWAEIRNRAFSELKGSHPRSAEEFVSIASESWHVPRLCISAEMENKTLGIIRAVRDEQPDRAWAFIGPIAVEREYRGGGIGRALLRETVRRAQDEFGLPASLCVNADNRDALKLYEQEGFKISDSVEALVYPLN
jgi:mycothiol synthase